MNELKLGGLALKTPAVCGVIQGRDVREMSRAVSLALKKGAELVELRIDSLRDRWEWQKILKINLPLIFTNRPKREGGAFAGSEKERVRIILEAIENKVPCIDIEFSTPRDLRDEVVNAAKREGVSVLMSWHDFSRTPATKVLKTMAEKMVSSGGDLIKVVTLAREPADAIRILDFLVDIQDKISIPVIAFAMGEAGKITRIASPLLGSPFTYASVGRPTAPGQLDVAGTKLLLQRLLPRGGV
ncbi:MAG: type I 3-dehydroquinate dehydratase [Candidatus Hadarchaeum sp.]|uniref:type I 3-dehydroquinate dehydratase n=1 Tax=Candidatus Hadarchaeum sp. TaxID=2883567 RepID=UPI003D0F6EF7